MEARQLLAIDLAGAGVPNDMIANLNLFIGDHSVSNSEIWSMNIGGQTITSSGFGVVDRVPAKFKRGESYGVTVSHVASNRAEPDFDYRAWVDRSANPTWTSGNPAPGNSDFFVADPGQLFQRRHFGSGIDSTVGKSAILHFPAIDLDVDSGNSGSLDQSPREDFLESDSTRGASLDLFNGDLDGDNIPDNYDFNGVAGARFKEVNVSLSSNLALLPGASQKIKFEFNDAGMTSSSTGLFRLWKTDASAARTASDLIRTGVEYDAQALGLLPGTTLRLFLEAVNPTNRTVNFDPVKVTTIVNSPIWSGSLTDNIHVRRIRPNHVGCATPEGPDGVFDAVDDLEQFVGMSLADGGVRNIDVLKNDKFLNSFGSEFTLDVDTVGFAGSVEVLNAPSNFQSQWFANAEGEGQYEFGEFTLTLAFHNVIYSGDLAHASWTGQITIDPDQGESSTLNVVYSTCMNRNYTSGRFGDTVGSITGSRWMDSGLGNLVLTVENYQGYQNGEYGYYDLSGGISATGVDILEFTQPSHGTSAHAGGAIMQYTPDPETTAREDSFTYTIWNLIGQTDTATVRIKADPDRVKITALDDTASEVPGNTQFDKAKLRFSRQFRTEEQGGNSHTTTVYFSATVPKDLGDSRTMAELTDWSFQTIEGVHIPIHRVGWTDGNPAVRDPVFSVTIPSDETKIDYEIIATLDSQFELDEFVHFTIVDFFFADDGTVFAPPPKYFIDGNADVKINVLDKTADIDFENYDDFAEDDPGISVNPTLSGEDLYRVTIRSHIPEAAGYEHDFFTIHFDPTKSRFWWNRDKSDQKDSNGDPIPGSAEIFWHTRFDEDVKKYEIWMEVLSEDAARDDVRLIWTEYLDFSHELPPPRNQQTDSFTYSSLNIDVDIDSDNSGTVNRSVWEDYLEDHPYALGKLVKFGSENSQKVIVKFPTNLAPETMVQLKLETDIFSGNAELVDVGNSRVFESNTLHIDELENLNYNPSTGFLGSLGYFMLRGIGSGSTIEQLGELKANPKPAGKILVRADIDGKELTDKVHFVHTNPRSILWDIQDRPELRASLASNSVYDLGDMPKYGLQRQTDSMLNEMSVSSVYLNGKDEPEGFKAALYRDFTQHPNSYILSFAGTEDLSDWANNLVQAVGSGSPEHYAALTLGFTARRDLMEYIESSSSLTLIATGHSLGGGLASAASVFADLPAYTFNAAGLARATVVSFLNFLTQNGLLIDQNDVRHDAVARYDRDAPDNPASQIKAYYDEFDILSSVQDSDNMEGAIDEIQNAIGHRNLMEKSYYRVNPGRIDLASIILGKEKVQEFARDKIKKNPTTGKLYLDLDDFGLNRLFSVRNVVDLSLAGFGATLMGKTHSFYQWSLLQYFNGYGWVDLYGAWLKDDGSPDPIAP